MEMTSIWLTHMVPYLVVGPPSINPAPSNNPAPPYVPPPPYVPNHGLDDRTIQAILLLDIPKQVGWCLDDDTNLLVHDYPEEFLLRIWKRSASVWRNERDSDENEKAGTSLRDKFEDAMTQINAMTQIWLFLDGDNWKYKIRSDPENFIIYIKRREAVG